MNAPAIVTKLALDWQDIDGMVWLAPESTGDYIGAHNDPATGEQCRATPRRLDVTSGTKHRVVSADPLHIEPSLACEHCAWHGFIRDGHWVPA